MHGAVAIFINFPIGTAAEIIVGFLCAVDFKLGADHLKAVNGAAHGELLRVEMIHVKVRDEQILHTAEIEIIHELVHVGIRRQIEQKIVVDDSLRACADVFAAETLRL